MDRAESNVLWGYSDRLRASNDDNATIATWEEWGW
jgi:hypothetical protein